MQFDTTLIFCIGYQVLLEIYDFTFQEFVHQKYIEITNNLVIIYHVL